MKIQSVKAWHSTRQKGLKKFESRTTMATIDTGEGAHVHGWGLYLQADEMANRELYYYQFAGVSPKKDKSVTIDGKNYTAFETEDIVGLNDYQSMTVYETKDAESHVALVISLLCNGYEPEDCGFYLSQIYEDSKTFEERGDDEVSDLPEILQYYTTDEIFNAFDFARSIKEWNVEDLPEDDENVLEDGTHSAEASQYTVEIPDDMVFIDEDNHPPVWICMKFLEKRGGYENSRGHWINFSKNMPLDVLEKVYANKITGRQFYDELSRFFGNQEKASLWLSNNGVDGMTYDGRRDNGCFVIYNCDKLKIIGEY